MHMNDTDNGEKRLAPGRSVGKPTVALALLACLSWVSPLLAQETVNPPEPSKPVFQWLFALGITIVCVAVAFKNPRRSHLG